MSNYGHRCNKARSQLILSPAYPFTGPELLESLRSRVARELGYPVGLLELSEFMGRAKSTVHFWLSAYRHPHLLAFMALLERLSPSERRSFVESHCRPLPLLSDANLVGETDMLRKLLTQPAGLTVIAGNTHRARTCVLTAFGHSWRRVQGQRSHPVGIAIHRPNEFVPLQGLRYIDERLTRCEVRDLVLSIWHRIMTSRTELLLANRLWSAVPEVRNDLLRAAKQRHVVLAEASAAGFAAFETRLPEPVYIVNLSQAAQPGAIHITCRRLQIH